MPRPISATDTEFVSLVEMKAHVNVRSTADDAELALTRDAAQQLVETWVGPVLHRTVTESAVARRGVVALRTTPVLEVAAATASGVALTYTLDTFTGQVTLSRSISGAVDVTYTAGRDSAPDPIRLATLIIAGHMWRTQQGNAPGIVPGADDELVPLGLGYSVPNRAMELLAPYLLAPAVA